MNRYYLSSLDSYVLETTRTCDFLRFMHFTTGKECVLAKVDPPIPGQQFGITEDIATVVLANRHEGDTLSNILEFPCFVHVARPLINNLDQKDFLTASDVENIAWGELYRTRHDAENHIFDR
jgi:hypothetical protein